MNKRLVRIVVAMLCVFIYASGVPMATAAQQEQLIIALPDFGNQVPVPWQEFAFGKSYMRLIYTALVGTTDAGKSFPYRGPLQQARSNLLASPG